jgi:DMSO/TMAO reductase YedYZ molybdopterin-dependent catalytic subunit
MLPLSLLSLDSLKTLPRDSVVVSDGVSHRYYGVPLHDLLVRARVPTGRQLRGEAMSLVLRLSASDGYHVVLTLPELDPDFADRTTLIAYEIDGNPLSAKEGPLRLVMDGEKRRHG